MFFNLTPPPSLPPHTRTHTICVCADTAGSCWITATALSHRGRRVSPRIARRPFVLSRCPDSDTHGGCTRQAALRFRGGPGAAPALLLRRLPGEARAEGEGEAVRSAMLMRAQTVLHHSQTDRCQFSRLLWLKWARRAWAPTQVELPFVFFPSQTPKVRGKHRATIYARITARAGNRGIPADVKAQLSAWMFVTLVVAGGDACCAQITRHAFPRRMKCWLKLLKTQRFLQFKSVNSPPWLVSTTLPAAHHWFASKALHVMS